MPVASINCGDDESECAKSYFTLGVLYKTTDDSMAVPRYSRLNAREPVSPDPSRYLSAKELLP